MLRIRTFNFDFNFFEIILSAFLCDYFHDVMLPTKSPMSTFKSMYRRLGMCSRNSAMSSLSLSMIAVHCCCVKRAKLVLQLVA